MKKNEVKLLNNKFKSIELLNAEGCILKAFKTQDGYIMLDEHRELIGILSDKQIFNYTRGDLDLIDSEGRNLKYTNYPSSMKPELSRLCEFLSLDSLNF